MSDHERNQDIVNRKRKYEEDSDSSSSNNESKRKFLGKEIFVRRTGLLDLSDEVLLEVLKLLDGESLINLAKYDTVCISSKKNLSSYPSFDFLSNLKRLQKFINFHSVAALVIDSDV